jgi:hypothetical protein
MSQETPNDSRPKPSPNLRSRMLAWAARARANPSFDRDERDFRLEIARSAQEILDAGRRGEPLAERIESLHLLMARRRVPQVVLGRHLMELRQWANEDGQGLARALEPFNRDSVSPKDRVERLAEASRARDSGGEDDDVLGLVLGSLFNFATAPGAVPLLRLSALHGLRQLLGEQPPSGSIGDQYLQHVEFVHRTHEALVGAGIPARDVIDTEALILICWEDSEFWIDDDDGRRPRARLPDHYLTACAIYRDEAPYLAEWLEFHRLVGFERFYLYDNRSVDNHREVLAPYLDEGLVTLHDWPRPHLGGQAEAYDHCLRTYGAEARWIGFFDIDEFVFSPTYRPVSEVLTEYEQWPGVVVNAPRFGPSGHRTKPDGLVIENYVVHVLLESDRTVKSIVDPAAVESCHGAHLFNYRRRSAVDENGYPVHHVATKTPSFKRLRLNHYFWKSVEEFATKRTPRINEEEWRRAPETQMLSTAERRQRGPSPEALAELEAERGVRDEAILHYVEPVRAALRERSTVQK